MVTMGNIQQLTGPRPPSADQKAGVGRPEPMAPIFESKPESGHAAKETGEKVPTQVRSADPGDPAQVRDYLGRVAAAMEKATDGPHLVGFRLDPESGGYLVEVRSRDGEVVTTLTPQKTLNRPRNPDELTGMLVDYRS